jgi:hypothetical protein
LVCQRQERVSILSIYLNCAAEFQKRLGLGFSEAG